MHMGYAIAAVTVICAVAYFVWLEIRGQRMWVVSQHTYEGFPLLLRHVDRLPFPSRRKRLPKLAIITHTFAKRRSDGLPDPDYNNGLFDLDMALIDAMKLDGVGTPVLIETFGGKRMFYYYVADQPSAEGRFQDVKRLFDGEELSFDCRADPEWGFIQRYAKDYFPDLPF